MNIKKAAGRISHFFANGLEWILVDEAGRTFPLRRGEIETSQTPDRLLISFLDANGFQTWRVNSIETERGQLVLELSRNFGRQRRRVRFVARVSTELLGEEVEVALLEKANAIAHGFVSAVGQAKLVRVSLNRRNGSFARMIFRQGFTKKAALVDIFAESPPEMLLANAVVWLHRLERRKRDPVGDVVVLTGKKSAAGAARLHSLLRMPWAAKIRFAAMSGDERPGRGLSFTSLPRLTPEDLWRERAAKLSLPAKRRLTSTARRIVDLDAERIDHIFSRHGETLRFLGLPFARVRRLEGREECWFGIERERTLRSDRNFEEFEKLVSDLGHYRRFDSPYKRHEYYRRAPEAWLDSILRRNIRLLDTNLVLSPIFNQFRASRDRIDLLALRRDGRLIIVELKVAPDREMIFQALEYWRKIELQRRAGILNAARLFGKRRIADRPALVYLAAPTLGFHREFRLLAETISPEIGVYRFDLNEDWRRELKVLSREKLG